MAVQPGLHTTRLARIAALMLASLLASSLTAAAQNVPTEAQRHALRANCVSDYRANCATVPTGGMAALVCLEQHADKLSPACRSAVRAVQGAPKSDMATAATTQTPAPAPKAAAPKDIAKAPGAAASSPPKSPTAKPETAQPRPHLPFFLEVRIAARACRRDFRLLCPDVPLGHGNAIFCLKVHAARLHPRCRRALLAAGEILD